MKTILVTGFGAFGTTVINPAKLVAEELDGVVIGGAGIVSRIMPNTFFKSIAAAQSAIAELSPDIVIMLGEFGWRSMITVERLAHNLNDSTRYKLADNDGKALQDTPTVLGGPVAYYATLPIRAMVKAMREAGVPADISDTAATFVCNHLMYGVLHYIAVNNLPIRAGWIHLPFLPVTAVMERNLGAPSMSLETSVAGVKAGIQAVLDNRVDIDEPVLSCWQV